MELFYLIILGLIQGLTEFLPVSSSGHLVIIPWLFEWGKHPLAFDIILHSASLLAIIIYFRGEWIAILREGLLSIKEKTLKGPLERKLFYYIIIASLPAIVFGSIAAGRIEACLRSPLFTSLILGIFGLFLFISEARGRKNKDLREITLKVSLLIGLSQMIAVIPGVSRSGITITAALLLGMNRESSIRFSFLLGAPIIFAALCYSITGLDGIDKFFSLPGALMSFITSFIASIVAIHFLLRYVRRHSFTTFAVYRLILSLSIVIIFFLRG